jgi:ATP-dependent DNA helicase RecQ
MSNLDAALEALRQHFGFSGFREGQDEVIDAILAGEDALVVMPTGGGKSLCYQLPALMREGTTLVVSPLIALMKDQVDALDARDIPATFINSSLDFAEQTARLRAMRRGGYKLVYVAPERFRNERFVESLAEIDVALLAVDEAHCISEWGHDFRPDYRRLSAAAKRIGRPQIVALTATATPEVRADIAAQLELGDARHFIAGFDRPNLTLRVAHTSKEREKVRRAVEIVGDGSGSGIIYAATRKAVETVSTTLRAEGLRVRAYHAGLDDRSRSEAQDAFMGGAVDAIVATNAFGMGIDKRDIRFVVHYHLPGSIEAYYQEIGRAGRDGLPATCTLLFNYADTRFQQFFIDGSFPPPEFISDVYRAVVALGPGRHEMSARDLAARANLRNDMAVNSALAILERAGHIERAGGSDQYASVEFGEAPGETESDAARGGANASRVLSALTSPHPPRPGAIRQLNLSSLASTTGLSTAQVRRALEQLDGRGVLRYRPSYQEKGFSLVDASPAPALRVDRNELARRAAAEQRKLRRVTDYAYHRGCLRAYILSYFGDRKAAGVECGACSGCEGDAPPRRGARSAEAEDAGTLRVRGKRRGTELDAFILDSAPTGDALRERLRSASRDRALQQEREVLTDPEAVAAARAREPEPLDEARTTVVRKVLACVARARERFGKTVIAGVLRGSKAKNVVEPGLAELSTYGILSSMTQDELVSWCDALVDAGLLGLAPGAYPTLFLTPRGKAVMRGEEEARVNLRRFDLVASGLARSEPPPRKRAERAEPAEPTVDVTFALYRSGLSIDEIAERRSLSAITIENHVAELLEAGRLDDVSSLVELEQYRAVERAAREHGVERLKPIHDALGGAVRYREIRFVVADLKRKARE